MPQLIIYGFSERTAYTGCRTERPSVKVAENKTQQVAVAKHRPSRGHILL